MFWSTSQTQHVYFETWNSIRSLFGVLSPEICMQFRRETAQIALLTWGEGDSGIRSTNSGGTKNLLNPKSTNNHMYLCIYLYIYI